MTFVDHTDKLTQRAKNILLHQLSRSIKSKHQLRLVLEKREIPEEIALAVLDRFEEAQLIDDREFARAFVASRLALGGKSRSAIARELRQKGIADSIIEDSLVDLTRETEAELALALATRRSARLEGLDRQVRYRRLTGFLARRGFSQAVISSTLRQID
jgi:regulatory protein